MKACKVAVTLLLVFLVVIVPIPVFATNNVTFNGQMDSGENWVHWFTDQTYEYCGYPHQEQSGNTLGFDAYYTSDSSNLYIFVSTDDNTVGDHQR